MRMRNDGDEVLPSPIGETHRVTHAYDGWIHI